MKRPRARDFRIAGPDHLPERPGMAEALVALHLRQGKPSWEDDPPPSTFPMTPAAREALRLGAFRMNR